jgi:3-deoxy-D-manno-octulosonate cytidylyltransferase
MATPRDNSPPPAGWASLVEDPRVLVVIPARYGSSRFPGKALADLAGQPLIVRVAANAARMRRAHEVVVATDDQRIFDAVTAAGHACEMTAQHPTGTDRIGEVAARRPADIVLNLQGDEPLLDPAAADGLVDALCADPALDLATCAHPFADDDEWRSPHAVKVVTGDGGRALYFSRAPIPGTFPGSAAVARETALRHVGIYAYRRAALERFLALPPSPLETCEGLEQLRALGAGMGIGVVTIAAGAVGVDTPEDLERVRALWRGREA